jgi:hypothetical protein
MGMKLCPGHLRPCRCPGQPRSRSSGTPRVVRRNPRRLVPTCPAVEALQTQYSDFSRLFGLVQDMENGLPTVF